MILWECRDRRLEIGARPLIMGVLNVTPDSFSDGGRFLDPRRAIEQGRAMIAEGADLVDVGGESTRPGAAPVDEEEELRRVLPVVEALATGTDAVISVDTCKARVAAEAVRRGASVINDVTALTGDPGMEAVARSSGAGVVLMHMQCDPRTMQANPVYGDVVADVTAYLRSRVETLALAGWERDRLAVDPGIGFGKTVEHNVALLKGLGALAALGRPVVVGVSRKSFIGKITGREVGDRLAGSLVAATFAALRGAHIIRAHDVKESCDLAKLVPIFGREDSGDDGVQRNVHTRLGRPV